MWAGKKILKILLISLASGLLWVAGSDAAIYKWVDENGKTHFTDDPTRVPEAFRNNPFLKSPTSVIKAPENKKRNVFREEGGNLAKENIAEKSVEAEEKESEKTEGLTDAQRSSAEAVANFLNEDISRYDKFYDYPPSRSKFRAIKAAVKGATAQKQVLLGRISQIELPLFQEVAGFLKSSIVADEKSQKVMPTTLPSARQTFALTSRLKAEGKQESQLLGKITIALGQ